MSKDAVLEALRRVPVVDPEPGELEALREAREQDDGTRYTSEEVARMLGLTPGSPPPRPEPVDCHLQTRVEHEGRTWVACYWPEPQPEGSETGMARAWISPRVETENVDPPRDFDAYIWSEGAAEPRVLLGCSSKDFADFGHWVWKTVRSSQL